MKFAQLRYWLCVLSAWLIFPSTTLHAASPSIEEVKAMNQVAAAHNRFGFSLLKEIGGAKAGQENLFLSPASIAWALEMVLNGAGGTTYQAMAKSLQVSELSLEQVNQANFALKTSLESADPQVKISIANSLWGKDGVSFLPAFLAAAQKFYAAALATLKSAAQVNAWVNEKTQGKISAILSEQDVTPDTLLILVNALYFKGLWSEPFDKALTQERDFHSAKGVALKAPMMSQSGQFSYAETSAYQALALPYGAGRLRLSLILPTKNSSLTMFMQGMDAKAWEALRVQLRFRPGKIVLPKFKMEYGASLNRALAALGMAEAFSGTADLSKIATMPGGQRLFISEVRHKTFVELNEEGTEAAAVTAIGVRATGMPPPPQAPFEMIVDRPFFVAIEDVQTGLILFMGSVVEPKI